MLVVDLGDFCFQAFSDPVLGALDLGLDVGLSQGNRVKESCGEEACEEVVVPGGGFAPKAE